MAASEPRPSRFHFATWSAASESGSTQNGEESVAEPDGAVRCATSAAESRPPPLLPAPPPPPLSEQPIKKGDGRPAARGGGRGGGGVGGGVGGGGTGILPPGS